MPQHNLKPRSEHELLFLYVDKEVGIYQESIDEKGRGC